MVEESRDHPRRRRAGCIEVEESRTGSWCSREPGGCREGGGRCREGGRKCPEEGFRQEEKEEGKEPQAQEEEVRGQRKSLPRRGERREGCRQQEEAEEFEPELKRKRGLGREKAESRVHEDLRRPVRGNRAGSQREGAQEGPKEGQESSQAKVQGEVEERESDSSSSEEDSLSEEELEDTLFQGESKIQRVGQRCPGALACQAITTMRANLLQEAGATKESIGMDPVAMLYLRQHLHRRASGPALRELVTLAIAVDQLLRARPSRALDTLLQRFKAVEAGLMGAHWSVAQRLELGPSENLSLTGQEELSSAQKEAYTDARTKMLAGLPDGRSRTSKGQGKSKDKDDFRKDRDKGRGKGSSKDKGKQGQKEDQPPK